jgi:pyrroline-5-carboxylate reductase
MKISIIGCGNMGLIYARAFLKYNIVSAENLLLAEKNETRKLELERLNIGRVTTVEDKQIAESEIVIIAVKPQDFSALSNSGLKAVLNPKSTIISIMAGIKLNAIAEKLNHTNIVRAMPNSPAELGMGMTAFTSAPDLSVEQVRKAENLLATTGRTLYLDNEELLNAATAISGSGPAYFFYFVQQMTEAAKKMGLDEGTAAILVKQTMLGSFHLLNNAGKPTDELIKAVTSKGGTTEAAFVVFNQAKVGENIQKALLRACERSRELSAN